MVVSPLGYQIYFNNLNKYKNLCGCPFIHLILIRYHFNTWLFTLKLNEPPFIYTRSYKIISIKWTVTRRSQRFFVWCNCLKSLNMKTMWRMRRCIYLISILYGKDWWAYSLVKKDQQIYIRQLRSEDVPYMQGAQIGWKNKKIDPTTSKRLESRPSSKWQLLREANFTEQP